MLKNLFSLQISSTFVGKRSRLCLASILSAGLLVASDAAWSQPAPAHPVRSLNNRDLFKIIPGEYIVVFKTDGSAAGSRARGAFLDTAAAAQSTLAQKLVERLGGRIGFVYRSALVGFSAKLPEAAVRALQNMPGVAYVEPNRMGTIATIQPPTPPVAPPAGIDRTSERLGPPDGKYTYSLSGAGVNVYILDTGIRATNTDFGGRASGAVDFVMDGNGTNDCNGHGTHVAGSIGGTNMGIAKQVTIHAVRVATCGGSVSNANVIAGVDWVTTNAVHPAVANMSLQFSHDPAIDTAVTNSVASGVTYAVAAGNFNADACTISPASTPTAITVGSIDPQTDQRASDSDWGTCLDLFGPGVNILSDWNTSDTATAFDSGTSMASPHVAGVAALILQNNPAFTPADVLNAILFAADVSTTPGWGGIVDPQPGSPNILLHWGSAPDTAGGAFDGYDDGDPHLITVDGTHYNFQGAGEYVYLRHSDGLEI
jgi:subtilisin family serine protease